MCNKAERDYLQVSKVPVGGEEINMSKGNDTYVYGVRKAVSPIRSGII